MERFGRFEFDPTGVDIDATAVWSELQAPLLEFAQSDAERFVTELVRAVLPVGGFAFFGAARTIWNLLGPDFRHPGYDTVRMAALQFFRANGVPNSRLSANDWQFWLRNRAQDEPWLVSRPLPPREIRLVPLAAGELRRVAVMTAEPDSNVVYVRGSDADGYMAVVEGRENDAGSARRRFDWLGATTLYDLYLRIGQALQVPSHWVAAELAPFVPLSAPNF